MMLSPNLSFHFSAVLTLICCCFQAVALSQTKQEHKTLQLKLRSQYFVSPLSLEDDPRKRKITSIELRLPNPGDKPMAGRLRLDESPVSFDEFGDANIVRRQKSQSLAIKVGPLMTGDKSKFGRKLFGIQLLDEKFSPEIHLAYSTDPLFLSRLLIRTKRTDANGHVRKVLRILPLFDIGTAADDRRPDALRSPLRLSTPHLLQGGGNPRPALPSGQFSIWGELGGSVRLIHNLNSCGFNAFGEPTFCTLRGYPTYLYKLQKKTIEDPEGKGHLIWDLIATPQRNSGPIEMPTKEKRRYRLVMSPHAGGPHRLIVYRQGSVQFVLPLNNSSWERFERMRRELARAPVQERTAIEEIRRLVGDTFRFRVESDHVVMLDFSGRSATRETMKLLPQFAHLKRLRLGNCRDLDEGDLQPLERLRSLENVAFHRTPVSDTSLKYLRNMVNLRYLRLYDEPDRGEKKITVPQPSDKGLTELAGLARLESIHLYGEKITDVGLLHLRALVGLRTLHLHRTSTTVPGLVEFSIHQPSVHVNSAEHYGYDPTEKGVALTGRTISDASLRALTKLPIVQRLYCGNVDNISADGMKHVATIPNLESLRLSNCGIRDATLAPLQQMKTLKTLELWYCRSIGDKGVAHLHELKIEKLQLTGTAVTDEGIAQLKQALPNCEIKKDR